ncbi:hypothetical protein ACFPT5_22255 [Ornithinimicrobium kibberense]
MPDRHRRVDPRPVAGLLGQVVGPGRALHGLADRGAASSSEHPSTVCRRAPVRRPSLSGWLPAPARRTRASPDRPPRSRSAVPGCTTCATSTSTCPGTPSSR